MDEAISLGISGPRVGFFRIGVYNNQWDRIIKALERAFGHIVFEMTRRELALADTKDATTGYFDSSYSDKTIKGVMISKSATRLQVAAGAYVSYNASLLTADPVLVGDQVKTKENVYYEVMTVTEEMVGDSFSHRVCDLNLIPMYKES